AKCTWAARAANSGRDLRLCPFRLPEELNVRRPVIWLATAGAVLGLFIFDFYAHVKTPHEPTFKESAIWSTVYIVLALVFGVGLGMVWGWDHGKEYFAGYVTEKSLSVDNLFVFLIIMTKFAVPRIYQQKVLLVGVAVAL